MEQPPGSASRQSQEPSYAQLISYNALRRSRTTLEDFTKSYFPLHGFDPVTGLLQYLDIIVFIEATIYQMDEENEQLCLTGQQEADHVLTGEHVILAVLQEQGLLDARLEAELAKGRQYWAAERELCQAMLQADKEQPVTFTLADVHTTSESKSFDYRVLNLLVYKLTKQPYNEALLEFLFVDEHLVDIGDDLVDYEDDVVGNTFNIYRAYVHLFRREAQLHLVQRITQYEQRHDRLLEQLPEHTQQIIKTRQKEAASIPGSDKWIFPQPILDEAAFRAEVKAP